MMKTLYYLALISQIIMGFCGIVSIITLEDRTSKIAALITLAIAVITLIYLLSL
jgi:hypothetical protein